MVKWHKTKGVCVIYTRKGMYVRFFL